MKVYLGDSQGRSGQVLAAAAVAPVRPPLRLLLSYFYYKDEDIAALVAKHFQGIPVDLFADSGAYSAWTGGKPITVQEYADWLGRWGHLFTCAAALDVIGDAQGSWDQTLALRKLVDPKLEILPVFHSIDRGGFTWLQRYIDHGFTYIGISPTAAIYGAPRLLDAWLCRCFKAAPPGMRYHGFGVTGWKVLCKFPFYSVDSSSWTSCFRYASLQLFDQQRGQMAKMDMRLPHELLANAPILASYGLTPREVKNDSYDRDKLVGAMVQSWQRAEAWLTRRHGQARPYFGTISGSGAPNSLAIMGKAVGDLK